MNFLLAQEAPEHDWFSPAPDPMPIAIGLIPHLGIEICRLCGLVRRPDGRNQVRCVGTADGSAWI